MQLSAVAMTERFSASSAGKHMACPASANLPLAIPNWSPPTVDDDERPAVAKGHNLHESFARIVSQPARDIHAMVSALDYVAQIRSTRKFKVLSEHTVQATWLTSQPQTTADLVLFVQDEIHVFDLKTGRIPVEVVGNEQLLFYAVCYAGLAPQAKGVHLHILQPWADGNQTWFADTNVLQQFMADAIAAEKKILAGDTTFGPSDHCKFCPANPHSRGGKGKPLCPAMMKLLYPPIVDEDEILSM